MSVSFRRALYDCTENTVWSIARRRPSKESGAEANAHVTALTVEKVFGDICLTCLLNTDLWITPTLCARIAVLDLPNSRFPGCLTGAGTGSAGTDVDSPLSFL